MTQFCPYCQMFVTPTETICPACGKQLQNSSKRSFFYSQAFPDPPMVDLEPRTQLANNRFTIIRRLGRGGFSTVYLAEDAVRSEQVALKIVALGPDASDDAAAQLRQETLLHNRITDYRHVIRVHDMHFEIWCGVGLLILSMEHADGGSLRAWLLDRRDNREARRSQGIAYFKQLCSGVAAFHDSGIVHGDLKPENALFCGAVLKVADFGIARFTQMSTSTCERPFLTDSPMGTLAYWSPDQILAAHPDDIDHRSDIYTLGIILYEILHPKGRPPFGGSPQRLRERHLEVSAPPVPDATPAEARVLQRCLAKNASDRYGLVTEIIEDLENRTPATTAACHEPPSVDETVPDEPIASQWASVQMCLADRDLSGAHRFCESILTKQPDHSEAAAVLAELHRRYQQAQQFYQAIDRDLDRRPLCELTALLTEAVDLYPEHPDGTLVQVRLQTRARTYRNTVHRAVEALRAGHWEDALALFQTAQRVNAGVAGIGRAVHFLAEWLDHARTMREHIDEAIRQRDRCRALRLARDLDLRIEELKAGFEQACGRENEGDG